MKDQGNLRVLGSSGGSSTEEGINALDNINMK